MVQPRLKYPILVSMLAALLTLALKWAAYALTGSVGILSDATESFANLLAAIIAFFSLWYSSQPVDPTHTYGHEKIEYFSSGLEGSLIIVAAIGIAWYAVRRLIEPEALQELDLGVLASRRPAPQLQVPAVARPRNQRSHNGLRQFAVTRFFFPSNVCRQHAS